MKRLLFAFLLLLPAPAFAVTRMYTPLTGTAPANPKADGGWDDTTGSLVRRPIFNFRRTVASGGTINETSTATNPELHLIYIGVSAPMAAQTLSGTIKGQFKCLESAVGFNGTLAIGVEVWNNTCTTLRGTALAISASDNTAATPPEFPTATATNRKIMDAAEATSLTLTNVSVQDGDRLVLKLGVRDADAGTSRTGTISFEDIWTVDLAEDETATGNSNSWVEFSANIVWDCPQGPQNGDVFGGTFTNPASAAGSNNIRATEGTINDTMFATTFNFNPDASVTIDGILVEVEAQATGGTAGDNATLGVQLSWNAGANETGQESNIWLVGGGDSYQSYGSSSYLWGRSWSLSEFTNANFGVILKYTFEDAAANQIEVDHIRVTLYCSAPAGTGNIRRQRILRAGIGGDK